MGKSAAAIDRRAHFAAFLPLFDHLAASTPMLMELFRDRLAWFGRGGETRDAEATGMLRALHGRGVRRKQALIPLGYPPVVFFSPAEAELPPDVRGREYCLNRSGVGEVVLSLDDLVAAVRRQLDPARDTRSRIAALRAGSIFHVQESERFFVDAFDHILARTTHPEWECFDWAPQDPVLHLEDATGLVGLPVPILLEERIPGYDIVWWEDALHAIGRELRHLDISRLDPNKLAAIRGSGRYHTAPDWRSLCAAMPGTTTDIICSPCLPQPLPDGRLAPDAEALEPVEVWDQDVWRVIREAGRAAAAGSRPEARLMLRSWISAGSDNPVARLAAAALLERVEGPGTKEWDVPSRTLCMIPRSLDAQARLLRLVAAIREEASAGAGLRVISFDSAWGRPKPVPVRQEEPKGPSALVERNYKGFDLYSYASRFWALDCSVGESDPGALSKDRLRELLESGACHAADLTSDLKSWIDRRH